MEGEKRSMNDNSVQSVVKACQLLDILAEAGRPLALYELAQRTGWAKSTIHGLLSGMRPNALIEQSPIDGKYRLGIRLFEYGNAVCSTRELISASERQLRHIVERCGESVTLSTLDRGEVLILDHLDSDSNFRIVTETGSRLPAYCTAQGKALLAYRSPSEYRRILEEKFTPYTPHTIQSREQMERELTQIREQGYAIENGEFRIGLRGVAAPISGAQGTAMYAIGVVGMFRRIESDEFAEAIALVTEAAKQIEQSLGYRA